MALEDKHIVSRPDMGKMPMLQHNRRGSIYLLILGIAAILTVIGLGAVSVSRVNMRSAGQSQDWSEAQSLAFSAVEHALAKINADGNWRATFNGQTVQKPLGRGTFTWRLVDDADGNLTDDPNEPFTVVATGTVGRATYSLRAHMTSGASGTTAGVIASSTVTLTGSSWIDSYDSSLGAYGGSNVGSAATVQTNSTAAAGVSLAWSTNVKGSVQIGPNGNPATVVAQSSGHNVTGTVTAMPGAVQMPTPTAPTNLGASTGDLTYRGVQNVNVSGNLHVNNFTVTASAVMNVTAPVTILAEGSFSLSGSGVINIRSGGSLTIYSKNGASFSNSGVINLNGQRLSTWKYYNLGTSAVTISGAASVLQGVIVSPNGPVTISGSGQMGGAILTNKLSITGAASFHEDKHITNQSDPVPLAGGGGTSNPKPDSWTRAVQ